MIVMTYFILLARSQAPVLGEQCPGYCREKDDCLQISDGYDCADGLTCCQNKVQSDKNCKDYEKYVYEESHGIVLMARSLVRRVSECKIEAVPLVVGGIKAKEKEFPHMVAIGYGKDVKEATWMCGGSLISEIFVLSAAHCTQSRDKGPATFARIGTLNLDNSNDPNAQDFLIVERKNHPKYKPPSRYNDIALFKLSKAANLNGNARPACLFTSANEFDYKKATATGWGKLSYNDNTGSSDLMKVSLDLIDYFTCNASFSSEIGGRSLKRGIITSQFCAGKLEGGKDTCQGDSGGPIQIVTGNPYCMYSIIGITSFGKFCGYKNSPAVYTKVSYYVPWIESIIQT